jgi:hypothetical protein
MNVKLTLAMLVVLLVLAGVVLYVAHQPRPAPHRTTRLVFTPRPTAIRTLAFHTAHGRTLRFERHGRHWRMIRPVRAWARDYTINDLVQTLRKLSWHYRVRIEKTGGHSPAAAGLAPPRAVLTLTDKTGKTYTLDIGRHNSDGRLYVCRAGMKSRYLYVVGAAWLRRLERPSMKFRNRNLTRFHTARVASIRIQSRTGTITIVRHGQRWIITKPFLAPANKSKVANWLSNVQLLTAHRFSSESQKSAAWKQGPLTIEVRFQAPSEKKPKKSAKIKPTTTHPAAAPPLVIHFGRYTDLTDKFRYALSSQNPTVCVVRNTTFQSLDQSLADWRDKALTRAKVMKATRLAMRRRVGISPATPASLYLRKNKKGAWRMGTTPGNFAGGPLLPADAPAVQRVLKELKKIRAGKFIDAPVDLKKLGLNPPRQSLRLDIPNKVHPVVIALGTSQKNGWTPAKLPQWPSVYLIPNKAITRLLPPVTALRSRIVTAIPGPNVSAITITSPVGAGSVRLLHISSKWMLTRRMRKKTAAPAGAVQDLLDALNPVQNKQWYLKAHRIHPLHAVVLRVTTHTRTAPIHHPPVEKSTGKKSASAAAAMKTVAKKIPPARVAGQQVVSIELWNRKIWPGCPHLRSSARKPAVAGKLLGRATIGKNPAGPHWYALLLEPQAAGAPQWVFQPSSMLVKAIESFIAAPSQPMVNKPATK